MGMHYGHYYAFYFMTFNCKTPWRNFSLELHGSYVGIIPNTVAILSLVIIQSDFMVKFIMPLNRRRYSIALVFL